MSKDPKDSSVGPWAKDKLDSLRRGLDYYTTRLKNQPYWQKLYVDAFAGPGLSRVRTKRTEGKARSDDLFSTASASDPIEEEVEFLKGSPRVALELRNPFDIYIFIEKDPQRASELGAIKREYETERRIEIRLGDANEALLDLAELISKRTHRVYVFLDPFGLQVPWATIEALARTGATEVMINFPMGMAIRRMMPRSGDVPPGWQISLTSFFGSSEWERYAYEEVEELFGKRTRKLMNSEARLLVWYRERLHQAFGYVSEAQLITNTRGGHLYYLIWAGPHQAGLTGANYILSGRHRRPQ